MKFFAFMPIQLSCIPRYLHRIIKGIIPMAALLVFLGLPMFTLSAQAAPAGYTAEGFVMRFNVSDLFASLDWYESNLGLIPDFVYGNYSELSFPTGLPVKIALNEGAPVGSNKATATIVVEDIDSALAVLESNGVYTTPICNAYGAGSPDVLALSFFTDPDLNSLALRQENYYGSAPYDCGSPIS
ncbi:MAG: VOC family protein [Cyanothece sp. SIO2G6]|nr:VOC family protein [Cyanothece sp. SIO2G6]